MRVGVLNSISTKLFFLMTGLVVFTVAINLVRNSLELKDILTTQVEDTLTINAEQSSREINSIINNWVTQAKVSLSHFKFNNKALLSNQLDNFLTQDANFVALGLFEESSGSISQLGSRLTRSNEDPRFEGISVNEALSKFEDLNSRWVNWLSKKSKDNVRIKDMSKYFKLPIVNLALRFELESEKKSIYFILAIWKTSFINVLPKGPGIESFLIDNSRGLPLAARELHLLNKRNSSLRIVKMSRSSLSLAGLSKSYKDKKGREFIGVYSKAPDHRQLSVIVQKDKSIAYASVERSLKKSLLYGVLFLLIAVLVSFYSSGGITRSLRDLTRATEKVAQGDFNVSVTPRSNDEVGLLSASVNEMAYKINNLLDLEVESARTAKELETAKMVQSTLFPKQSLSNSYLKVSGFYNPATECGGDLWGYFEIEEGVYSVFIADAMGHGVPAALVTAIAYSTCKTVEDIVYHNKFIAHSPKLILERLNRIIFNALEGKIHMTCFFATVDLKRGSLIFANAGHNFPVLVPEKSGDRRIKKVPKYIKAIGKRDLMPLRSSGMPMGLNSDIEYSEKSISIKPGDKVILFTDGIIEGENQSKTQYGKRSFYESIVKYADYEIDEYKSTILREAYDFFNGVPQEDDITLVAIEIDKTVQFSASSVTAIEQPLARSSHGEDSAPASAPLAPDFIKVEKTG